MIFSTISSVRAIAAFYTRIAAGLEGKHEETGALAALLKKKD